MTRKFWTCGCDRTNGDHIVKEIYNSCVYCRKNRSDLKEIIVPSNLGGVFEVEILKVEKDFAKVKVVNNSNGFEALQPFNVKLKDVEPRWKRR